MNLFKRHILWLWSFALAIAVVSGYFILFGPPSDFPRDSIITINRGLSAMEITEQLHEAKIIKNPTILRAILQFSGKSSNVRSGTYLFAEPENVFSVANRLYSGDFRHPPVIITIPEGLTVREISVRIAESFPQISASDFYSKAKPKEGYLFPDTYHFAQDATIESIIDAMRANFDAKIAPFSEEIQASGRSLSDIVIMASLIEKEARTDVNKRIISGILWKRLDINMLLQVDAVFGYIFGRDTFSPSYEDLEIDSPYNTYKYVGLPPGPIANPGLRSIIAALRPTPTEYLFYLTGRDNKMHYATTYEEHRVNRRKHLYIR